MTKKGVLARIKVPKSKINLSMKCKRFDIKESVFQQYILTQSQHERHRNRDKYIINASVLPSLSIDTFTQTQQQRYKNKHKNRWNKPDNNI